MKCCLRFEKDQYLDAIQRFPEIDTIVQTSKGEARIDKLDIFKNIVYLRYGNDDWERLSLDEVNNLMNNRN